MDKKQLKNIVEGALLAAREPLSVDRLRGLFVDGAEPEKSDVRESLAALQADYEGRAMELVEIASGWRIQVRNELSTWVSRLWEERPQKYSRALLETLSLIAYKQPITRGEIEDVRGVAVSTNIMRTLLEREWIRVVGHREVPGRPALFATTREFLDYFNLKSLEQLPSLREVRDLSEIQAEIELPLADQQPPIASPDMVAGGDAPDSADGDSDECKTDERPTQELLIGDNSADTGHTADQSSNNQSEKTIEQADETGRPTPNDTLH